MARENVDVLIAGGGFAGLTLAIALRQALGPSFAVTVADPALGVSHAGDERASAIVAAGVAAPPPPPPSPLPSTPATTISKPCKPTSPRSIAGPEWNGLNREHFG